ncbi:MAG: hypothetical protein L3J25_07940 [Flavobacteriaceae bacterium]|nr:hypothetical protein [Flavobacteriaceae bacterium]
MKPISRMIEKIKEKKSLLDVILLRTDWLNSNEKNVYLKASNFETEQMYYQNDNNKLKPKGYLWVDDIFVLLYNDTNTFFSKINEPKDILKNDKEIKLLVDVHTSYYHYIYRKDTIYSNIEEYIELKGEMDEIEN